MSIYTEQIAGAVRGTAIHSATRFSWFAQPSPALTRTAQKALTPATARAYLQYSLQQALYSNFYTRGQAMAAAAEDAGPIEIATTPFVADLAAANTGKGTLQSGWVVQKLDGGGALLQRDGLSLQVPLERLVMAGRGRPAPGARVRLRAERELLSFSPGFYVALSNAEFAPQETTLVRIYWHLLPGGAKLLMRELTTVLNRASVPFQFKVLNDPERYQRCDAGVLYFRKQDRRAVLPLVGGVYPSIAPYLRERTPAFTKPLAPGLGLAEDPGGAASFGQHRCDLLAAALIDAHTAGRAASDRLAHCLAYLQEHGVDPEAPYLNQGSTDEYQLAVTPAPGAPAAVASRASRAAAEPVACTPEACLQVAVQLGQQLAERAIWHEDRCNWVSMVPDGINRSVGSLEPDLYAGTGGVSLYLAELACATGDDAMRRVSLGAMRQSLRRVETHLPIHLWGLYCGVAGIAFTAVRVGQLLGVPELAERGRALIDRIQAAPLAGPEESDLIFGLPGGIVSLLAMQQMLGDRELQSTAVDLGDRLLRLAQPAHGGLAWPAAAATGQAPLTGLSHGAAGAGYALLELYRASGEPRFRQGAEGAFAFERHWFDSAQQNWADLRAERTMGRKKPPFPVETQWCHGSAGIALARMQAAAILGQAVYQREARVAVAATCRGAEQALAGTNNFSLCHGLAGAADVLCEGAARYGDEAEWAAVARRIAEYGLSEHALGGTPWRCGIPTNDSPALMLGLAGVGRFYLRLYDPALPSILLLDPRDYGASGNRARLAQQAHTA